MKVKNAYQPPIGLSKFSIIFALVLGVASISLALDLNLVFNIKINFSWKVQFYAVGMLVLIWSIYNDYKGARETVSKYKIGLFNSFKCPQCQTKISKPLEHEKTNGVPILFACGSCEVLWFAGTYVIKH